MSTTLIPEADSERLFELEETGETDELRALATQALEEAELTREYDIGYTANSQKNSTHSGTHYTPTDVSPYYDGHGPEIHVPLESEVENFYANLNGEFRLIDSEGEDRTYKLVISCDNGMLLKGEIGFGEREITEFRYTRSSENYNSLEAHIDGNWCRFGNAPEVGEGNQTMTHIELIESAFKQLTHTNSVNDQSWEIVYGTGLEDDFESLPPQIESTVDNKTSAFKQNLELGVNPENMLSAMSPPWKPLLEMRLGSDYRAMFITGSNLPQNEIPEQFQGNRKIIGLSVEPKKEFKEKFRSDGGNQIQSAIDYSLDRI